MSVVYFIQAGAGGPVKIGVAGNLKKRVETLQIGCPEPLVILATIDGDRCLELKFHRALAAYRLRGEWFKPAPRVLEAAEGAKQEKASAESFGAGRAEMGADLRVTNANRTIQTEQTNSLHSNPPVSPGQAAK